MTAQQTRDAMKLAPTAGDPAAGSVDKHLDDIEVEVDKIPRLGETMKHRQVSADSDVKSVDVIIEEL